MTFEHRMRVRFAECDIQGVVFNANYLAYVDDAVECWMSACLEGTAGVDFAEHIMVKRATVEWSSAARWRDELTLVPRVSRWGTSSFDVTVDGAVGERAVFSATLVYIAVDPIAGTPTPVPDRVRAALGGELSRPSSASPS